MQAVNELPAVIRIGKVTEFDPKTLRARVSFPELDIVSFWLPVICHNTIKTKDTCFLDEGEHVVCLMQGSGTESGFILGSFYDDKNPPPVQDKDKRTVLFDDGTSIAYDRGRSALTFNCAGDIIMKANSKITLNASRIDLN